MTNTTNKSGTYIVSSITGEKVKAFCPRPLPLKPPLDLTNIQHTLEKANQALGRLDGLIDALPNLNIFLFFYVRREALLSSQIEGTQSSMSDLLLYEIDNIPTVPLEDVEEVSNYIVAAQHAIKRLEHNFPLSLRLIRETHEILLRGSRGQTKQPGVFRTTQNWIGGTRPGNAIFVPPPPDKLPELLSNFEKFLHLDNNSVPMLVKNAIAHAQFETLHPFLDGNGRIGRLLITLLLCNDGILKRPILYPSIFLKKHRRHYYDLLQDVREKNRWEAWVEFFLEALLTSSEQAIKNSHEIIQLVDQDRTKIDSAGRAKDSAQKVYEYGLRKVLLSIPKTSQDLKLSQPTVTHAIMNLVKLGIFRAYTNQKRNRIFVYHQYFKLLEAGCE